MRHPVVARDVLIGVVGGAAVGFLFQIRNWSAVVNNGVWFTPSLDTLLSIQHTVAVILSTLASLVNLALATFCFLVLARVLVRKQWVAALIVWSLFVVVNAGQFGFDAAITTTHTCSVQPSI